MNDPVAALRAIYPDEPGVQYTKDGSGLFVPSPWATAHAALQAAGVGSGTRFLDLGSGDGRVVALAALLGADAHGIEHDAALHERAEALAARVREQFPAVRLTLRQGDLLQAELAADALFYYAGGCVDRQPELYARLAAVPHGTRVLIMRTQRQPEIALPLSARSQPPYFYLFTREE
jgi:protein-L-isoaspartate O-methyltransferase